MGEGGHFYGRVRVSGVWWIFYGLVGVSGGWLRYILGGWG